MQKKFLHILFASSIFFYGCSNTPNEIPMYDIGCIPENCPPAIDNPQFKSRLAAENWLTDNELVFGIEWKGETKAYPAKILRWHEVVNDEELVVTYSVLSGSPRAFLREGRDFFSSGKLVNNNLVLGAGEERWQQLTGQAFEGNDLQAVPLETTSWQEWKEKHPLTKVLSRDTGHQRDYNAEPYPEYSENNVIYFPVENIDDRLEEKQIVYGDLESGNAYFSPDTNRVRSYWFVWSSFFPESIINEENNPQP